MSRENRDGGSGDGVSGESVGETPAQRAVPYLCPFCGDEDLRPEPAGRWHCRACLRLFSLTFHGLLQPAAHPTRQESEHR